MAFQIPGEEGGRHLESNGGDREGAALGEPEEGLAGAGRNGGGNLEGEAETSGAKRSGVQEPRASHPDASASFVRSGPDGLNGDQGVGDGADSRALSVTRPAVFSSSVPVSELLSLSPSSSSSTDCTILAHGVDTLDVGLFVEWGGKWPRLTQALEQGKRKASGTQGILFGTSGSLILPSGKKPCYRWHLQFPGFHFYLSRQSRPTGRTPNVYVSLGSQLLWTEGVRGAVERVEQTIERLGGQIRELKISRFDPCVDLRIPGGVSLQFLRAHLVPPHRKETHYLEGDRLETFYVGAKESPIQLRMYDKGVEIAQKGKGWFLDIWKVADGNDVWRVEFQLRRDAVKQFGIDSIADLDTKLPGVWQYLTGEWVSLRIPDDPNATRRPFHPLWQTIHDCASRFGDLIPVKRQSIPGEADVGWYIPHIAGCLEKLAVLWNLPTLDMALPALNAALRRHYQQRDFEERVQIKAIQHGSPGQDGKESE